MDLNALQMNYMEKLITNHLQKHGMLKLRLPKTLPLKYDSHSQFMETYLPLIYHNCWAQIVEDHNQLDVKTLKLFVNKVTITGGLYCYIHLRCLIPNKETHTDSFFFINWLAFLQPENSSTVNTKTFAFVDAYSNVGQKLRTAEHLLPVLKPISNADDYLVQMEYTVRVLMPTNNVWRQFAKGQTVTLTPIYYLQPTLRQTTTLSSMFSKKGFKEAILEPDRSVFQLDTTEPEGFKFHGEKRFNEEQKKAIFACYNAVEETTTTLKKSSTICKTVMVQGPPGTGKTHTLVGIVNNLLVNSDFDSQNSPMRILICAPSNGAIDTIAMRLIEDINFLSSYNKDTKLKILRIGQRAKVHRAVLPFHLEHKLDKVFPPPSFHRKRAELREKFLLKAHIILSTLNSVQASSMRVFKDENPRTRFRCVIIDEAGQSTEPELLMPLVYPISKLILIGDHKQLPATVVSRFAQDKNYGRSMLERTCEHFNALDKQEQNNAGDEKKKELQPHPLLTLKRQFRMRTEIVAYPSATFYEGRLETLPGTGENKAIPLTPYRVFDVTDTRELSTKAVVQGKVVTSTSKCNLDEATFVLKLILAIFAKLGYPQLERRFPRQGELKLSIGVITFYQVKKDLLCF